MNLICFKLLSSQWVQHSHSVFPKSALKISKIPLLCSQICTQIDTNALLWWNCSKMHWSRQKKKRRKLSLNRKRHKQDGAKLDLNPRSAMCWLALKRHQGRTGFVQLALASVEKRFSHSKGEGVHTGGAVIGEPAFCWPTLSEDAIFKWPIRAVETGEIMWPPQSPPCKPKWAKLGCSGEETQPTSAQHVGTPSRLLEKLLMSTSSVSQPASRVCKAVIKADGGYFETFKNTFIIFFNMLHKSVCVIYTLDTFNIT